MPNRHRIRLKEPWWAKIDLALEHPINDDKPFKATVPFRWHEQIPHDFVGTVGMMRKFNCSPGMSQAQEVWLTISCLSVPAELLLNGSSIALLKAQSDIEIPVSSFLKPSLNELEISLSVGGISSEIILGEVALAIAQ